MSSETTPTELSLAHINAIASIQTVSDEALVQLSIHGLQAPQEHSLGVTIVDGENIVEMDDGQFGLAYALATNRIAFAARKLLESGMSRTELLELRRKLNEQTTTSLSTYLQQMNVSLPDSAESVLTMGNDDYFRLVSQVNQAIQRQIVDLATIAPEEDILLRGSDLAHMFLETQEENKALELRLQDEQVRLEEHTTLIRKARSKAKEAEVSELPVELTEHDRAFLLALEMKAQKTGFPRSKVKLVTVNDIDSNMKDDETGISRPGNAIGVYLDSLDRVTGIHPRQRLQLTDSTQTDPTIGYIGEAMVVRSGMSDSVFFRDAIHFAQRIRMKGLPFYMLTANMHLFGIGAAKGLGVDNYAHVRGMHHNSFLSQEGKPQRLMETALEHIDDSILIFTDDRDRRSCEAVVNGRVSANANVRLEEVYFFGARDQGDGESSPHKFALTLQQAGISYASNRREQRPDGLYGYQGTNNVLTLYERWQQGEFPQLSELIN